MIHGKKLVVVLPAYNAELTLTSTFNEIPMDIVDEVVLVDDASSDKTRELADKLGIHHVIRHEQNKGYGGNQKTCYKKALELNADIVIMLHPDYQYTPKLIPAMATMIAEGLYDMVLGSRILGKGALKGGMPVYKYIANRFLTFIQNILISEKLSEYHTGYRAYSKEILETVSFEENSDDFVFDNEFISQTVYAGFKIGEVSCPTKYFDEASSINFSRSVKYGLGVLRVSTQHFFARIGLGKPKIYKNKKG
jgi:glycosyltransferase involved in cell wall biosynthesis